MRERIERWYKMGLWSAVMVQDAARKGVLTESEAAEILGQ